MKCRLFWTLVGGTKSLQRLLMSVMVLQPVLHSKSDGSSKELSEVQTLHNSSPPHTWRIHPVKNEQIAYWLDFGGQRSLWPHICPILVNAISQEETSLHLAQMSSGTQGWTDQNLVVKGQRSLWRHKNVFWPFLNNSFANYDKISHKCLMG